MVFRVEIDVVRGMSREWEVVFVMDLVVYRVSSIV